MKKTILVLTIMMAAATLVVVFSGPAMAKVTGPCVNCHTMHNSQGGTEMATGGPNATLLMNSCVGCHTGTNAGGATPFVLDTSAPTFGTNTLAGGNFWWVKQAGGDAKGHNVLGISTQDGNITTAEGAPGGDSGCANSCHVTLAVEQTSGQLSGKHGCEGCHINVMHHADDGTGTKYVDTAAKGWYRFLAGHLSGDGFGVKGIEHEKWNYGATASSHNEYHGVEVLTGGYGFGSLAPAMTAYCTGCHDVYHTDQQQGDETGSNPWIRHPSDKVIPDTAGSEYAAMNTQYNPNVPVARPSGFAGFNAGVGLGVPSGTVAPGTDMVMCLSCHVAHGSPYDDMLRWDYADMNAGGGSNTTGCFVCHTGKDGVPGN